MTRFTRFIPGRLLPARSAPFNLDSMSSPRWDERAEVAVELLASGLARLDVSAAGLRIADLGAGSERLRSLLSSGLPLASTYAGFDLLPQTPSVMRLDVRSELPPGAFDVAFCLGLLEYLEPLDEFLERLAGRYPAVVVSYTVFDAPSPLTKRQRRTRGWLTHFTTAELELELERAGFNVVDSRLIHDRRTAIWLARSARTIAPSDSNPGRDPDH